MRSDAHFDLAVVRIDGEANGQPVTGDVTFFPIGDNRGLDVKTTDAIDVVGLPAAGRRVDPPVPGNGGGGQGSTGTETGSRRNRPRERNTSCQPDR